MNWHESQKETSLRSYYMQLLQLRGASVMLAALVLTSCGGSSDDLGREMEREWDCLDGCPQDRDSPEAPEPADGGTVPVDTGPLLQVVVGPAGEDGDSCSVSDTGLVTCGSSQYQIPIPSNGIDGQSIVGPQGEVGAIGPAGESIVGPAGPAGVDGITTVAHVYEELPVVPYLYIAEIINPCGDSEDLDEVLLRLSDGQLLGHYSKGNKQFFVVVPPGDYSTTDGDHCDFQVTEEGEVTWEN